MSHPTTTAIEFYALSRLHGRNLVEHLLICEACRARFSKEEETVRSIRSELETEVTVASTRAARVPNIFPFQTHLPLYSLEAAAGKFGKKQEVKPEGWIEVQPGHSVLTKDMFVTHVEGYSMEPRIPDGSLCAFRSNVSTPYSGKVLLLERYGEAGGNRYTVSQYRISNIIDSHKEGDLQWLHERFMLEPLNPEYPPWEVASDEKVSVIGEFAFLVQSGPSGQLSLVS
jgi:phage repressor protein C with HTH and peptisase S24 domain